MPLMDKVALITGASRGLGEAIAIALAKKGATVVGTATSAEGARKITQVLKEAGKGQGYVLNVTNAENVTQTLADITAQFATPNILVNNAAITRDNIMLRMKPEEWDSIIDTNLNSIYRLSKACLRAMVKARWGRIINISSIVGVTGNVGQANYAAAKAGMIGFSKSLAQEVGTRGITVNVVAPGFIDTDMTRALPDSQREYLLTKIPLQKLGQPADVAHVVAFLASDEAAYITGQTLHVNGGMYMA